LLEYAVSCGYARGLGVARRAKTSPPPVVSSPSLYGMLVFSFRLRQEAEPRLEIIHLTTGKL
jgi:hypothetical protein